MSRRLLISLVAGGVLLGSGQIALAAGVEFDAAIDRKGIGRCHMDVCSFFQIETVMPMAVLKDGTLFAVSELSRSATYKTHGENDEHEYDRSPVSTEPKKPDAFIVFCSKTRPHIFFFDEGNGIRSRCVRATRRRSSVPPNPPTTAIGRPAITSSPRMRRRRRWRRSSAILSTAAFPTVSTIRSSSRWT